MPNLQRKLAMTTLTKIKQQKVSITIIFSLIILSVIGISVWFLRQQTVINPHAAASTTIAFTSLATIVNNGQKISSDIIIDPSNNQVSVVKLVLSYDSSQLQVASDTASLVINQTTFPQILDPATITCTGTQCLLSTTIAIGSNPINAIVKKTKFATFTAMVLAQNQTEITVGFDKTTSAYSLATTDQANENVLSSTVPLSFTVGSTTPNISTMPTVTPPPICAMNIATCAWDTLTGASSYHYKITNTTTGAIIKEGEIPQPQSSIEFPQQIGATYSCDVHASSVCGAKGQTATTTNTCSVNPTITPTRTPTVTITPTKTPTLKITITPTSGVTPTITPIKTVTPTTTIMPTKTITMTPMPTATPIPQVACNAPCSSDANCQSGLSCVGKVCRNPSCSTKSSCTCTTPTPMPIQPTTQSIQPTQPQYIAGVSPVVTQKPQTPKIMPTGPEDILIKIGLGGIVLAIVGGLLMFGL